MDSRKLYDRFFTIFGTMMIFFYFFLAYFVMFSPYIDLDKPLRILMGVPMIAYGLYRITVSYRKIKENFFNDSEDE